MLSLLRCRIIAAAADAIDTLCRFRLIFAAITP
jgi:hypothetical protein